MQEIYKNNGSDEEDSIKKTNKIIDGIHDGEITETTSTERYFGKIKDKFKNVISEEIPEQPQRPN